MSRSVENSHNLAHRQLLRTVGGFHQPQQFVQERARSSSTVRAFRHLTDLRGHEGCVNVIVFSPSGDTLASGSDDGKVRLWDPYTFKCTRTMNAHQSNVFAAEFLPFNEQHLASGGNDAELKYYNLETEEGTVYSHHTRKILRMTVHAEHPYSFMSCSADGTVRMIDTRQHYEDSTSGPIDTVQGRLGDVMPQALGGGRGARIGRATGGTPAQASLVVNYQSRTSPQLYSVDFNPMNGYQFIVSSDAGDIRLFDLRQIRDHSPCSYINIYTHKIGNMDDVTGCAFSRDGRTIVATALSDAIYTFQTDCNYEVENNFPLCLKGPHGRKSPCDHSAHRYTSETITRYHLWEEQSKDKSHSHSNHHHPHFGEESDDSDDPDGDLDDSDDSDEDNDAAAAVIEEMMVSDPEESVHADDHGDDEPSASESSELHGFARRRRPTRAEAHGEAMEGVEPGDASGAVHDEEDDEDTPVMPNLRDLLGAWPILQSEGGAFTVDLETFLRIAAGAQSRRERRQRTHRAHTSSEPHPPDSEPAETTTSTASQTNGAPQPEATVSNGAGPGEDEPSTSSAPQPPMRRHASPYGPSLSPSSRPKESPGKGDMEEEKPAKEQLELPQTWTLRFTGHTSVQTIKGVGFWGPASEFVVSGSDDANFFIWDTQTGKLLNVLEGHDDVVNCVTGHPRLPMLATSGIDDIIKLWDPSGPTLEPASIDERIERITRANASQRRFGRGIQCAQQ